MEVDTIVAIVTPPGEGGVGVVRASGPLCASLPRRLFPDIQGEWGSHRMRHGLLRDPATGSALDSALGCLMDGPNSYTGEDVFEMHCHGSPLVLEAAVRICLAEGCRQARPGEFTLRAFLNGRLDLSQAEAVIDVVRARTNLALDLAVRQLSGWLSTRVEPLRQDLIGRLAHMEAMVDFVEEDIPPELDSATRGELEGALAQVETLLEGTEQGIVLREGATLAIVGSPNVGKSSLMNALLGLDRSIVTPIAGTTRDTVEETLRVGGIAFRTIDTAGITETDDPVESIGIDRSCRAIEGADVVVLVLDGSRALSAADEMVVRTVEESREAVDENGQRQRLVVALNKSDLPKVCDPCSLVTRLGGPIVIHSSAVTVGGTRELHCALEAAALGGPRQEYATGNVRHQQALQTAATALKAALDGLRNGTPLDLVSFDVRAAVIALGEITGANVDDELLDRIFRDFCIGK